MTRVMAVEWAQHNVQVNCICPGWIKTALTQPLWSDPERSRWILDRVPTARFGQPNELSGLTIYLACRRRATTRQGQVLYVNRGVHGGRTMVAARRAAKA